MVAAQGITALGEMALKNLVAVRHLVVVAVATRQRLMKCCVKAVSNSIK